MNRLFARLRTRTATRVVAATTFCERGGAVCTPTCRHEALRERAQMRAQELNLYRR